MSTDVAASAIAGVLIGEPEVHADARGRLVEIYRAGAMPEVFAQSNHSRSAAGVLRGLHFHRHQADLWYLVRGRAQIALADLRTPGRPAVETHVLDAERPRSVYIPPGIAHGYLALEELDMIYWVTRPYDASDEGGIAWDDPELAVPWQLDGPPTLSRRDASNPPLRWDELPAFA
jgi:dTDP-4-dehydrorhamnose 3,5-epimerase